MYRRTRLTSLASRAGAERRRPAACLPRTKLLCLLVLLGGLLLTGSGVLAQSSPQRTVVIIDVEGVIDPIVARYVERGLATSGQQGAVLVVLTIDTPGGLDSSMRVIVQAILGSRVPVVAYVSPSGARAASAGVFIAAAAHVVAMAPGTNIGAAHPVGLGGAEWSAEQQAKVTNDAVAYIRALAEQRGRNADWVEKAVRESASLSADAALQAGVIDLLAGDIDALVVALDGRSVATAAGTVTLDLQGALVQRQPMTVLESAVHILVNPDFAYILLTIGVLGIIAELYNPGSIIPGVAGVIALVLAFVGLGSLPVNWGGVGLIGLAVVLFLLDVYVSGFVLSIGGVAAFVLGSLLLFSPLAPTAPSLPVVRVSLWVIAVMTALVIGFVGIILRAAIRAIRLAPSTGSRALLGQVGAVTASLAPEGIVNVQGETWTAVSLSGDIAVGESVEVVAIDGLRLKVRRQC